MFVAFFGHNLNWLFKLFAMKFTAKLTNFEENLPRNVTTSIQGLVPKSAAMAAEQKIMCTEKKRQVAFQL